MKNIKTDIFFDLDHTLWDFDRNSALAFKTIFKKFKIDIDLETFLETYIPINLEYWKLYQYEKVDKETLRFGRFNDAFVKLNIKVEDAIIDQLSDAYIEHLTDHNFLFSDAIEILEYLKPNYNLHIITNGFEEVQSKKLKGSKIYDYFKTITTSEMAGVKKPNPKVFQVAFDQANASLETSIMVGDNYEADILGAINFGMEAICYNYHKEDLPKSIIEISTLIELKKYL